MGRRTGSWLLWMVAVGLVIHVSQAMADAPGLFCKPDSNKRLIPVCPALAPGGLLPVNFLSGFSERAPGNPSADAATRAWRSYGEVFSTYGGKVIWIDVFGSECAANSTFDPGTPPNFAKLVTFSGNLAAANHPELIVPNPIGGTPVVAGGVAQQFCFLLNGLDITTGRIPGQEVRARAEIT